jgi:hypothetical protein
MLLSVVQTILCWMVGWLENKKNLRPLFLIMWPKRTFFLITSSITSQYFVVTKTYFIILYHYWVITEVCFITFSLPWTLRNIFITFPHDNLFSKDPSVTCFPQPCGHPLLHSTWLLGFTESRFHLLFTSHCQICIWMSKTLPKDTDPEDGNWTVCWNIWIPSTFYAAHSQKDEVIRHTPAAKI